MLTRINFNSVSANELKLTIGSSINLINSLFLFSFFVKSASSASNAEDIIPLKPFKPSRKRVYSKFAEILGYKNWDELLKVSQNHTFDDIETMFVHQEIGLYRSISELFAQLLEEQYEVPKSGTVRNDFTYIAKQVSIVVADAIILNANRSEKLLAHYAFCKDADFLERFPVVTGYSGVLPIVTGLPTIEDAYGFADYFKYDLSNLAIHFQDPNGDGSNHDDSVMLELFSVAKNYRPRTLESGFEFAGAYNLLYTAHHLSSVIEKGFLDTYDLLTKPMTKNLMLEMVNKYKGKRCVVFDAGRPMMLLGDIISFSDED